MNIYDAGLLLRGICPYGLRVCVSVRAGLCEHLVELRLRCVFASHTVCVCSVVGEKKRWNSWPVRACCSVPPSWGFYPPAPWGHAGVLESGGRPDEKKANQYFTRAKTSRHTHFIFFSPRTLFINGLFLESWRMLMEWNTAGPRQKVWWHSFFRAALKTLPVFVFVFILPFFFCVCLWIIWSVSVVYRQLLALLQCCLCCAGQFFFMWYSVSHEFFWICPRTQASHH